MLKVWSVPGLRATDGPGLKLRALDCLKSSIVTALDRASHALRRQRAGLIAGFDDAGERATVATVAELARLVVAPALRAAATGPGAGGADPGRDDARIAKADRR